MNTIRAAAPAGVKASVSLPKRYVSFALNAIQ